VPRQNERRMVEGDEGAHALASGMEGVEIFMMP
jgi:hypothetical protein